MDFGYQTTLANLFIFLSYYIIAVQCIFVFLFLFWELEHLHLLYLTWHIIWICGRVLPKYPPRLHWIFLLDNKNRRMKPWSTLWLQNLDVHSCVCGFQIGDHHNAIFTPEERFFICYRNDKSHLRVTFIAERLKTQDNNSLISSYDFCFDPFSSYYFCFGSHLCYLEHRWDEFTQLRWFWFSQSDRPRDTLLCSAYLLLLSPHLDNTQNAFICGWICLNGELLLLIALCYSVFCSPRWSVGRVFIFHLDP